MVLPQQGAQFLLETHFRMMILLVPNVVRYLFEVGLADAEICIASLSLKIHAVPCLSFEPGTGNTLEFLDPIRLGDRAREACQPVDVVLNPASD